MHINELLTVVCEQGASDLHLKVGNHPIARIRGKLTPMTQFKRLVQEDTIAMAYAIMASDKQKAKFKENLDLDIAYSVPSLGRFRCNIFNQRGTVGLVLRVIPRKIYTIDDLMLPKVLKTICEEQRGLVLVTGTTGSGKSTTLAAMIDLINATRTEHILTIEDPIEYLHRDNLSIVNQREVEADCRTFSSALRAALRQDPDVILVGEMRDLETIETALHAAETGHLVFSTLHTLDATETINRVISVFPPHHQKQIRLQLAAVLKGVISQRLVPRADGQGRVPAVEVMVATETVRSCIEDKDKTKMLKDVIASGTAQYGMQTFDQSLYFLLRQGLITEEEALLRATNVGEFKLRLEGVMATADMARSNMERGMSIAQGQGREAPATMPPTIQTPAPGMPMAMPPTTDVKITLAR
ncbi:twitching motility protein PilT [Geothrix oryzae]|mgnify:CR=1 FL=1|jgi:twitching motility protein PilT|uniref:Twitching motility protein PilT n=1 Tax=Geothrix oryzae TaxID=2927975 RepID=A0ABN6UYJ4_9BACT|nr:type IV pilus twitching motility protein PilT [Geothrix oryzae]BDU70119.1 twitching motility protein PilT [Geothrix oryzae]